MQFLNATDEEGLAKVLDSAFEEFKVTAGTKGGKPDNTICVTDRETNKSPVKCPRNAQPNGSAPPWCDFEKVVKLLDTDSFKGEKINPNYIVNIPNAKIAKRVASFFFIPAPTLDLKLAYQNYLVLIPSPKADQAAKAGPDISKQAAEIRRDLVLVGELYRRALMDEDAKQMVCDLVVDDSLKKANTDYCYPHDLLVTANCAGVVRKSHSAEQEAEQWLAKHTVRFSSLDPRDVALALYGLSDDWIFQVRAFGKAITILPAVVIPPGVPTGPCEPPSIRKLGAYLAADSIERDMLYRQQASEQPKNTSVNEKQPNSTLPITTVVTNSTTTTQSTKEGKTTGAPVTTAVSTVTTSQTGTTPPGGAPTPPQLPTTPEKPATGFPEASTDGANAPRSQEQGGAPTGSVNPQSAAAQSASQGKSSEGGQAASETPAVLGQQALRLDNVVRLYHFRHAKAIAVAINSVSGTKRHLVEPLGENDDLLLILPSAPGEEHGTDLRRSIALIDLPRPQLSLQVWSYQISAEKKNQNPKIDKYVSDEMQDRFKDVKDTVNQANDNLMKALQAGYGQILDAASDAQNNGGSIFDATFKHYLTERYYDCVKRDAYCLGYVDALAIPPAGEGAANATLGRLLLFLIAVDDAKASDLVMKVINKMNVSGQIRGAPSCPTDRTFPVNSPRLCFVRFSEQLKNALSNRRNLHILRAALLDFLFEYKWTVVYGNDFIPYDLQRTAHLLDSYLDPIIDAFNQDVDDYVFYELRKASAPNPKLKATGLVSNGMVQVATLSGSQALIEGKVNNYFDITPSLSLNEILNTGNQSNVASAMKGILEPKEILMLQALSNIGTQPRISAQVTKQEKLTITPTTLDTASAAQLDVDFDVSEPSPPETVNQKAAAKDLLDRVAEHHVISHVRVDGLKLFQISEFTMELTHPERGTPVPIIGQVWESIFGTTPGIRNLFRMPPYSKTEENRSVAIVRAVVVPTAMDLGLSLAFAADRVEDPITDATDPISATTQAGGRLRPFHKRLTECVLVGSDPRDGNNCEAIRLSTTPEDLRNPTTP